MNQPDPNAAVILVPGDRFFLKEVALEPGADVASQVDLALEASAPFPLAQLFHGYVLGADRRSALAYAAYRRRFSAAEMAEWSPAGAVLPDFLGLIGPAPGHPLIDVQLQAGAIIAVAWDGRAALPVAVLCRPAAGAPESGLAEVVAELRRRSGLGEVEVRPREGAAGAGFDADGGVVFRAGGEETARFSAAALVAADVRDKSFLQEKKHREARQRGWSRAFTAVVVLLVAALAVELAARALALASRRRSAQVSAQAEEVRRIETAQTLATRIEDLAAREERPFEWLALVSAARPRSIQFTRVVSSNDRSLTIDAQTADAAAVGAYENALRDRPELVEVATRDLRSREGLTSFVLFVRFNPGGGDSPEAMP